MIDPLILYKEKVIFSNEELRCPETGIVDLHPHFRETLTNLRVALNMPMIVTSCCRSKSYNEKIKGHERSLHVFDDSHWGKNIGTSAIDIAMRDGFYNHMFIMMATRFNFAVGINLKKNFFHLDQRWISTHGQKQSTLFFYN